LWLLPVVGVVTNNSTPCNNSVEWSCIIACFIRAAGIGIVGDNTNNGGGLSVTTPTMAGSKKIKS
jgi:hypothetical protein